MVSWWVRSPRRGTSALWPKIQNPKLPQPFGNSLGCAGTVGWSGAHQDPELISEWRYIRLTVLQGTLGHEFLLPISSELPEHILWSINCKADKVILCNSTAVLTLTILLRNIEPMSMGHLAKIKARIEQDMNVRIEPLEMETGDGTFCFLSQLDAPSPSNRNYWEYHIF